MTAPRTDPHDLDPFTHEQHRDMLRRNDPLWGAIYDAGRPSADTDRTDPQSTVPVEPLSAERWHAILAADPLLPDCGGTHMMGYGTCQRLAAHTLDAARASQPITARPDLTTALRIALDRLDAYIDATDDETVGDGDTDEDRDFIREVREVLGPPPVVYPRGYNHRLMCSRMHAVTAPCDEALAALPVREDEPTGIDVERLSEVLREMDSANLAALHDGHENMAWRGWPCADIAIAVVHRLASHVR